MMQIQTIVEATKIISKNEIVLFYFLTNSCVVGEALLPKVSHLIDYKFPEIKIFIIDLNLSPKLAAHFNAFVEPTILVFFDRKEFIRKSINIGITELEKAIERPYKLIF